MKYKLDVSLTLYSRLADNSHTDHNFTCKYGLEQCPANTITSKQSCNIKTNFGNIKKVYDNVSIAKVLCKFI